MSGTELGSDDLFRPRRDEAAEPAPAPIHPESGMRTLVRRLLAPLAGAGMLALKLLSTLKLALLGLTKVKLLGTAATMLISVGAYALLWGWPFAALFVLLILVHELGHVLWLRREGVRATAPMFVPFLGAVIGMRGRPRDAYVEAKVGLAGPVLGSLGAAVLLAAGLALGSHLLEAAAYTGFLLNLFNLLPVVPLDGGRAMAAVHPALWLVGLAGAVVLVALHPNPILIMLLLFGGMELWRRLRTRSADAAYYAIPAGRRVAVGLVYLSLIALLWLGMRAAFVAS